MFTGLRPRNFCCGVTVLALNWQAGRFRLVLDRPMVMGIVNVTPDSFSDGGRDAAAAIRHCDVLLSEGADLLDIGGESTRPGSRALTANEELARVMPVVNHAVGLGVPVSVDTRHAEVMRHVLEAGADIVNDIHALQSPGALEVLAAHATAGVCLMHMQGEPGTMQRAPAYGDVVHDVKAFLNQRVTACVQAGIARARLCIDPGIGFGKTPEHNIELLRRQSELLDLALPLMVGWSRKSTLGWLTGRPADQRLAPSLAAALATASAGARIIRVHDVAASVDALKLWRAAGMV